MALLAAVLVASLTGSVHCAGMCGPLALVACGSGTRCGSTRSLSAAWTYQLARGVSYAFVGAVAGALGSIADVGANLVGLQQFASIFAGATLASIGIVMLLRMFGARVGVLEPPAWLVEGAKRWHVIAMRFPPHVRGAALGFVTPLLPCGWLWAFVIVAAGTASAWMGAAVMVAFFAGSVPALAAVVFGARLAAGKLGRFVQVAMALLLLCVGAEVALHRASIAQPVMDSVLSRVLVPSESAQSHVEELATEVPPCCAARAAQEVKEQEAKEHEGKEHAAREQEAP